MTNICHLPKWSTNGFGTVFAFLWSTIKTIKQRSKVKLDPNVLLISFVNYPGIIAEQVRVRCTMAEVELCQAELQLFLKQVGLYSPLERLVNELCVGLVVDCTISSDTDNPRLPTLFGESMIHLCQEFDYDMILCTFSDYLHVQILLNRLKYKS